MKTIFLIMQILLFLLLAACAKTESPQAHQHESESLTIWRDSLEVFIEYEQLLAGHLSNWLIHLSDASKNLPLQNLQGKIELRFAGGERIAFPIQKKAAGIYDAVVKATAPGKLVILLHLNGYPVINLGDFEIADESAAHIVEHDENDDIAFLKEQQWQAEFAVATAREDIALISVRSVAEVLPHHHAYAEIASPVEGVLSLHENEALAVPGSEVRKGETVAVICPPFSGENSWTRIQLEYQRILAEYHRALRLQKNAAISQREFQLIEQQYLVEKSRYDAFAQMARLDPEQMTGIERHLNLIAPISGTILDLSARPGQSIAVGNKLMTIVDLDSVWLQINLFESDYYQLRQTDALVLYAPGRAAPLRFEKDDFVVLSSGHQVDPGSRTIPLLIEVNNKSRELKIGQNLQVELLSASPEKKIIIPKTAVLSDGGQDFVYLQSGGESFVRRNIRVASRFDQQIAVERGLKAGDRVVSLGAYFIKLASLNTSNMGHGHAH